MNFIFHESESEVKHHENKTNKILHVTRDKFESMKRFDELQKAKARVIAQCYED